MTDAKSYRYTRHSDADLQKIAHDLETAHATFMAADGDNPKWHQATEVRAELKFRSQRGAVEALVTYHYDQVHDERRGTAQHWVDAIEATRADLLALDVPAELVERHVSLMRQIVGVSPTWTAAPAVSNFLSEHH